MIREKVESIKLEENDIKVLYEISNTSCHGVDCTNCDMYLPDLGSMFTCYKSATNTLLKRIGRKK